MHNGDVRVRHWKTDRAMDHLVRNQDGDDLLFVHANAWAPQDWGYVRSEIEAERSLRSTRYRLTFCGHTHVPRAVRLSDGRLVVNPGSVGMPFQEYVGGGPPTVLPHAEYALVEANGGALSSIGVSWNIINTLLSNNTAVGHGANSGDGGNGGAIYNAGNEIVLQVTSSLIENNKANEGGSAVFFVSNNKTGSITLTDSLTQNNPRGTFETPNLPGFYVIAKAPAATPGSAPSWFPGST